jgi:hypothetical protein
MILSRALCAAALACASLGQTAFAGGADNGDGGNDPDRGYQTSITTPDNVTDWMPETPIIDRVAIRDRTSVRNMTPRALTVLSGASQAASAVGLARIDILAAKGGGHRSHASGTEWDIIGYNADGTRWTHQQRIAVAEGARQAGADRFGIYNMARGLGAGTLHIGYSGPGRPAGTWGANGRISGAAARAFTDPQEQAFNTAFYAGEALPASMSAPLVRSDFCAANLVLNRQASSLAILARPMAMATVPVPKLNSREMNQQPTELPPDQP